MRKNLRLKFYMVLVLALVVTLIAIPKEDKIFHALGLTGTNLQVRRGLDLQGGASLTYQADLSKVDAKDHAKSIQGVVNVITKRVNPSGTSEVVVQTSGSDRVIVQLPGVTDVNSAINLIGKTAQLNFYDQPASTTAATTGASLIPTDLTGKDLSNATAGLDPQSGQPIIQFDMKSEAVQKFADLTTHINQANDHLVIVLDQQVLFNGTVNSPITDGHGQMQGFQSLSDAKQTTVLLNAGALPVPINLVAQSNVGATLGTESVQRSIVAGLIGLLIVIIFMISYYRLAGVLASFALIIYTLINISYFKISAIFGNGGWFVLSPITLSLAGIAGFILSIGMAVDANILIFERMKEEARDGKDLPQALNDGFKRAWNSIRDSNISTLITCLILYTFGYNPLIKGFAVTLAIGVLFSMFTAITITRTFMQMMLRTKFGQNPHYYGLKAEGEES